MLTAHFMVRTLVIGMVTTGVGIGHCQDYPNKPLRIVTSAPGAASDFASRLIAQGLTESLQQQVIVDNRGNFAADVVSKAVPDGYTMLVDGASFWIGPLLQKTPYDPVKDFAPITTVTNAPLIMVVHPSVAATSVKELIALAKARPGELNYGTGPAGGSPHLATELFNSMAGVKIVRVGYKGAGPAVNALLGGEIQLMIPSASSVFALVKSGKLRALAITSARPSASFPGVPTVAASGLPGYESGVNTGIFTRANTPASIVTRLNQEIVRVINKPEMRERFLNSGVEVVGNSPQQFMALIKSEIAKWSKVIKDTGISVD